MEDHSYKDVKIGKHFAVTASDCWAELPERPVIAELSYNSYKNVKIGKHFAGTASDCWAELQQFQRRKDR